MDLLRKVANLSALRGLFVWCRPLRACCPVLFRQRSSRPVRHGVTQTPSSLPIKRCVLRPAAPPPPPFVGLHCYWSPQPAARRVIFFYEALRLSGVNPLTWVPPCRSRLRLCAGDRNRLVRLSRRPARACPAPGRPVGCRPDAGLARLRSLHLFLFLALSFFVRSPPGPRLARFRAARGMPPGCGPGPAPFVPSFLPLTQNYKLALALFISIWHAY